MTWRSWVPDAGAAAVVLLLGLYEASTIDVDPPDTSWPLVIVAVSMAVLVGLSRRLPGLALGLAWAFCALQVVTGTQLMVVELVLGVVAFGTARWGSTAIVVLSALSIPAAAVIAIVWIDPNVFYSALSTAGFREPVVRASQLSDNWQVSAALLGMSVLGVPWLAGLALRFSTRARQSRASQATAEAERDQAEEIAQLREEQAQLARDVHDVVGHSLAVILAQAESAQYLDDIDTQGLKRTMRNIATSARTSLDDVRQVLTSTSGDTAPPTRHADFDSLVEGVRASGHEVVSTEVGTPHPMPPELEVVAFRVLQEMLTNAIKHGRRDQPVRVERHWEGDLRIEVENVVGHASEETQPLHGQSQTLPGGQGLDGMRRRLQAVGGHLDVRRRTDPPTFTATAWVPVRTKP